MSIMACPQCGADTWTSDHNVRHCVECRWSGDDSQCELVLEEQDGDYPDPSDEEATEEENSW
jgi:hypothetical protein